MPPSGVLMSTCLSSPPFSFCTLTLHAESAAISISPQAKMPTLVLRMRPSLGKLRRTLDPGAPFGDVRNSHGQMAAHWNLPEQRLDRCQLRHRRVGKRTHVILDLGEIAGQIR